MSVSKSNFICWLKKQNEDVMNIHTINAAGTALRKHQMKMFDMLVYIDKICQDNDIKYCLSGGTLLGAVRHKGFIPWDDDLDIVFLKKIWIDYIQYC